MNFIRLMTMWLLTILKMQIETRISSQHANVLTTRSHLGWVLTTYLSNVHANLGYCVHLPDNANGTGSLRYTNQFWSIHVCAVGNVALQGSINYAGIVMHILPFPLSADENRPSTTLSRTGSDYWQGSIWWLLSLDSLTYKSSKCNSQPTVTPKLWSQ
jgi:hypothetical protein